MKRYGLIGYPLSHSFSKKYFTDKFEAEKISAAYELYPLQDIAEVTDLLTSVQDLAGLNVTIPYKKLIIPYLHDASDVVNEMMACNCIKFEKGKLIGYNTDVIGFEQSLLPQLKSHHTKALILGSGGASAAVGYVLHKMNIPFKTVSRNCKDDKGLISYEDLSEAVMQEHPLIINTTPLGMYPKVNDCPRIPYQFITSQHYLYDLVYNPSLTLFLSEGKTRGASIKNGEDMLVIQAEESWKIWNQ